LCRGTRSSNPSPSRGESGANLHIAIHDALNAIDRRFPEQPIPELYRPSHADFLFALVAMLGVIGLGVLKGVLIAIVAAGVYLLARVSRPSDALLGCIPGRDGFYKLHREPRARAVQASIVLASPRICRCCH
jgi:MFS superfamily sulfate permease-like transporter